MMKMKIDYIETLWDYFDSENQKMHHAAISRRSKVFAAS